MFKIERKQPKPLAVDANKLKNLREAIKHLSNINDFDKDAHMAEAHNVLRQGIKKFRKDNPNKAGVFDKMFIEYTISKKKKQFKDDIAYSFKYYPNRGDKLTTYFKQAKDTINTTLRNRRKDLRKFVVQHGSFHDRNMGHNFELQKVGHSSSPYGGVHLQSGTFRAIHVYPKSRAILDARRPETEDNYIGIELEFFCKFDQIRLLAELYDAKLTKNVHLKTDGSIQAEPNYYPHELCILAKENEIEKIIKKVCQVLVTAEAKVNKSCGMHVHLDARARNKEILFANLVSAQNILFQMNPKSRQGAGPSGREYCKKTPVKQFSTGIDRYHAINPRSYETHRTIEVRLHAGVLEERKIINWVKLLIHIASKTDEVKVAARTLKGFIRKYSLPNDLAKYVEERMTKFKNGEADIEEAA